MKEKEIPMDVYKEVCAVDLTPRELLTSKLPDEAFRAFVLHLTSNKDNRYALDYRFLTPYSSLITFQHLSINSKQPKEFSKIEDIIIKEMHNWGTLDNIKRERGTSSSGPRTVITLRELLTQARVADLIEEYEKYFKKIGPTEFFYTINVTRVLGVPLKKLHFY